MQRDTVAESETVAKEGAEVVAGVVAVGIAFGLFDGAADAGDQCVPAAAQQFGQRRNVLFLKGFGFHQGCDTVDGQAVEARNHQQLANGNELPVEEDVIV